MGSNNFYHKHKRGDKITFEIAEVHTHYTDDGKPFSVYRAKGFSSMMFDDYGIEKLIEQGNSTCKWEIIDNPNASGHKLLVPTCVTMSDCFSIKNDYRFCPYCGKKIQIQEEQDVKD